MELKPCPFCGYGGDAEIMTWREPYRSNVVYAAQCLACGAIGEMGKTKELAAKYWNERAERLRCRDCKYVTDEGYGCKYFSHYEQGASYRWEDVPAEVEPDGFCAWGERRTNDGRQEAGA